MSCRFTKSELVEVLTKVFPGDLVKISNLTSSGENKSGHKQTVAEGLEFDSRQIKGGEIFIALKGANTHGHQFISTAYQNGASLLLVEDQKFLNESFKDAVIVVPDTQLALWEIAKYWRNKLKLPTIAVTGSVGKTTTKELMAAILVQKGPGCYAQKSFNNHVGVPYTILKSSPSHMWMVIEIGMNAPGEIKKLSDIASADVSVVTEVAPAHIGAFSSIEDIGVEKLSIVSGARHGTAFIVNGDNPIIEKLIPQLELDKNYKIITVGEDLKNQIRIDNIKSNGLDSISFRYNNKIELNVSIPGVHNAKNAAIACAAVKALWPEVTDQQLHDGLARFIAPLMRLNLKVTKKGIPILDDSYNANPASMNAMLAIASDAKKAGKQIGLVVGTMREMGQFAKKYHNELGQNIAKVNPQLVVLVGEHSLDIKEGISCESSWSGQVFLADNAEQAARIIQTEFKGDMLFVKGSRGIGLDKTVKLLVD